METNSIQLFSLKESQQLGKNIADKLNIKMGDKKVDVFSDGEIFPYFEESIRNRKIYIVGSLNNHHSIIELYLTLDAAKRAGAENVTAIIPYFSYARQDKKDKHRGSIGASLIANLVEYCGSDLTMAIDLHAGQIEGFFHNSFIHIQNSTIFLPFLRSITDDDTVIVSPDTGGVVRATNISDNLGLPLAIINKKRDKPNSIASMKLVGDVKNKKAIIIDDIVDTAGSLVRACDLLLENGATEVNACATHGVLSGNAIEKINASNIKKMYITDSLPLNQESEKVRVVSCATTLARIIKALHEKNSINLIQKMIQENNF